MLEAKRLGIMARAEALVAAAGIAADAQARQQAEARPFGTCVSRQGCDQPAGGKSRLCGRHLDALLDRLGA